MKCEFKTCDYWFVVDRMCIESSRAGKPMYWYIVRIFVVDRI